jgi:release factor glutamine methyltransferase
VTILEVIQRSAAYLERRGVDSPRLQAELLAAHVLGCPRMRLYLDFERTPDGAQLDRLRTLVQQRGERVPLQHLTGSVSFCGLELEVSRAALIPRPETERLAELAWTWLKGKGAATVLDFGTGTGCLAIAIAANAPEAIVHALDVSADALALARRNVARHLLDSRIPLHHVDGFGALPAALRFDCIAANPPYIPGADIASLDPEVRDHDPRLALDGGADGLDFFRVLSREARAWLKPGGVLFAEFGDGQADALLGMFAPPPWGGGARIESDLSGRGRFLVACVPAA